VRIKRLFILMLVMTLLTGCLTQILVSASRELLWQLLTPMIGLDPNQTNLFEQPIIKNRLTALLGPQYEPTMALLKTADELQREGPLFYVVSRYTPVPQIAEKAGFVWNSKTNQMAIMLVTGGSPTVIAEKFVEGQAKEQVGQLVPQWPGELQTILDQDALKKHAEEATAAGFTSSLLKAAGVPVALPEKTVETTEATPPMEPLLEQEKPVLQPEHPDADALLEAELKAQEEAEHSRSEK
jgi:hypothetical protein